MSEIEFIPMRLVCTSVHHTKPRFNKAFLFTIGKQYDYWTNFGGLNHFVRDDSGEVYPFDGPLSSGDVIHDYARLYIFDYFMYVDEWRAKQLDKVV